MEKSMRRSRVGYFFSGAVIGSVIGLLYAPRAGRATREQMGRWIGDKRMKGREVVNSALESGRRTFRRAKSLSGV